MLSSLHSYNTVGLIMDSLKTKLFVATPGKLLATPLAPQVLPPISWLTEALAQ